MVTKKVFDGIVRRQNEVNCIVTKTTNQRQQSEGCTTYQVRIGSIFIYGDSSGRLRSRASTGTGGIERAGSRYPVPGPEPANGRS